MKVKDLKLLLLNMDNESEIVISSCADTVRECENIEIREEPNQVIIFAE